ncbi:hypothetical protein DSL92_04860 [Billgrantia gudaonensis]|uniref:Uncharacterized protein n=1 Tax=Billgrantia gudaonensis TaxID=376427 RepID=A0A3S0VSV0_9GAMM|nr:hypothetical protein DSL92_04860 [Halomonas gudaonensis]
MAGYSLMASRGHPSDLSCALPAVGLPARLAWTTCCRHRLRRLELGGGLTGGEALRPVLGPSSTCAATTTTVAWSTAPSGLARGFGGARWRTTR